jgi:hypothetical protein
LITTYLKRHDLTAPVSPAQPSDNPYGHDTEQNIQKSTEDDISVQAELAAQEALRSVYGQNQYQTQEENRGA